MVKICVLPIISFLSILFLGVNASHANGVKTVASTVSLSITGTFWRGAYYMSYLNIAASNVNQQIDASSEADGLLAGTTAAVRLSNVNILADAPEAAAKGKLVAVWDGPGDKNQYPYVASFIAGQDPYKIDGYAISSLYIQDPFDARSTVKDAIRVKKSPTLWVPETDNPLVPSNRKKASGNTQFTFGFRGATPKDEIKGWGTYTADFKKLFTAKATLTGSVDQSQN